MKKDIGYRIFLFFLMICPLLTIFFLGTYAEKQDWTSFIFGIIGLAIQVIIFWTHIKVSLNEERVNREQLIRAMVEYNMTSSWQLGEFKEAGARKCAEEQVDTILEIIENNENHIYQARIKKKKQQ